METNIPQSPLVIILTSAAVGALVSSIVGMIGQYYERRSRERLTLLTTADALAQRRRERAQARALQGKQVYLYDPLVQTEEYYQLLCHLIDTGKLPDHPDVERVRREITTDEPEAPVKGG